jgi:opacity protein-like surface antigen
MKRSLLLSTLFSAAIGSAHAADMPVKAPVYVAPFTWTGVYLGINAGYGNSKSDGNEFCTTPNWSSSNRSPSCRLGCRCRGTASPA